MVGLWWYTNTVIQAWHNYRQALKLFPLKIFSKMFFVFYVSCTNFRKLNGILIWYSWGAVWLEFTLFPNNFSNHYWRSVGSLSGEATLPSSFVLSSWLGQLLWDKLLKERICSSKSKFFLFKGWPHMVMVLLSKEANRKSQKFFDFVKNGRKSCRLTVHVKSCFVRKNGWLAI